MSPLKFASLALLAVPALLCDPLDCFTAQGKLQASSGTLSLDLKNECAEPAAMWSFVCRNPSMVSALANNEDATVSEGFSLSADDRLGYWRPGKVRRLSASDRGDSVDHSTTKCSIEGVLFADGRIVGDLRQLDSAIRSLPSQIAAWEEITAVAEALAKAGGATRERLDLAVSSRRSELGDATRERNVARPFVEYQMVSRTFAAFERGGRTPEDVFREMLAWVGRRRQESARLWKQIQIHGGVR